MSVQEHGFCLWVFCCCCCCCFAHAGSRRQRERERDRDRDRETETEKERERERETETERQRQRQRESETRLTASVLNQKIPTHKRLKRNADFKGTLQNILCCPDKKEKRKENRGYLWWSLCTLYLRACQVRVTVGD